MISVLGIFAAEMVTGKDAIQQFGLQAIGRGHFRSSGSSFTGKTSSQSAQSQVVTRRAFQPSQQIGASEPLGFFDPLEITKAGDEQGFRKLRTSEIKHGRALLAQLDKPRMRDVPCVCVGNKSICTNNIGFFFDSDLVEIQVVLDSALQGDTRFVFQYCLNGDV